MPPTDNPPGTARPKIPATRVNTRSNTTATFKDPLATQISTVTDHASGLRFLQKTELLPIGVEATLDRLTTALFQVAQFPNTPAPTIDGIRAIAYLLESAKVPSLIAEVQNSLPPSLGETIANHVIASISPHVASLQDSAHKLSTPTPSPSQPGDQTSDSNPSDRVANQVIGAVLPHISSIHTTIDKIHETVTHLETTHKHPTTATDGRPPTSLNAALERTDLLADEVNLGLTLVANAIDTLLPSLDTAQSQINSLHDYTNPHPQPQGARDATPAARSYSEAVKSAPPPPRLAASALAKAEL